MATLPPATTISSSLLDEAVYRAPFFSVEGSSLRHPQKQRLPIPHSKQNASFSLCEKTLAWKISAMAASAPQTSLPFGTVEAATLDGGKELEEDEVAVGKSGFFDWSSQWYPVSLIDDLDKRVPTAVTVMGRHLVVLWDRIGQSWQVWDDTGLEPPAPLSDFQFNGRSPSRISPSGGSLAGRSQNVEASVYPSVEQDGLLWFWPDTRPESEDVATRKLPPSIPSYTDPAFKDKLHAMNLPYGYKKMIENLLEPAYVPFAHDEPQEDFLQDFENRLSSAVGYPSNGPSGVRANEEIEKQLGFGKMNGSAQSVQNTASKNTKAAKNGRTNAKLELSVAVAQNGAPGSSTSVFRKTNGSVNASLEVSCIGAQNGASGSSTSIYGTTNGTAISKVEIPYESARSDVPDSSTRTFSAVNGSVHEAEHLAFNRTEAVNNDSDNMKLPQSDAVSQKGAVDSSKTASQEIEGGLQNGKVPYRLLGDSGSEDVFRSDRLEVASSSSSTINDTNVSSSRSSIVVKKPVTSSRSTYEEEGSGRTNTLSLPTTSNENALAGEISKDPSDSGLYLKSGLQALRHLIAQKNFELAKGLVEELYEKYRRDTDVLMEYAFVEKQRGDLVAAGSLYSQAISAYENQQKLGYDYVRALQALGSIEARARNAKRARVLFMESIRAARQAEHSFPDLISGASVYGLHAWARLEDQLGNWGKARDLLVRAAEIQPGNAVVHQSRALLEAKAHNWKEARHHFSLAVESAPKDVKCWHAWAIFEASQKKHEKMRELFHRALEVDPKSVHCLQAWAHQETLIGTSESKDKARSLFQRCIQIEPKSLFGWQAWAVMEKNSGNHDKARELFEKCLEINSSSVACLQAYANMERHLKNWGAAQRLLRKALKLEPENAAVLMEAAFVESCLGNTEVGERLFVLAGMADKRKSRVRNKMFASRKEVMQSKADKGWTTSGKTGRKLNTSPRPTFYAVKIKKKLSTKPFTERQAPSLSKKADGNNPANVQVTIDSMEAKQRQLNKNTDTERQPSFQLKQKGSKPTNFQVAIDAIKAKQRELRSSFKTECRHLKQGERKSSSNFEVAIAALEVKRSELNKGTEKKGELPVYLKQGERAPSILGA